MSFTEATSVALAKGGSTSNLTWSARLVLSAFAEMKHGRLVIELPNGEARPFGALSQSKMEPSPGVASHALIRVRRKAFFAKCILSGDIGFAESFMDGDWDTPDLTAVIGWFVLNLERAPTLSGSRHLRTFALNLLRTFNRCGHLWRFNSRARARRNISEHYDLSNDFFALWLDPSMMYSSARWENADATLAEAQAAKNDALCRKLRLQSSDHVLEIGTGWGGWSLHAAHRHGCRITSLTISRQQAELARRRVSEAGLSDRIEILLQDYRDVRGRFDKIVSIEMLEAVGHRYLPAFAAACARALKPNGLLAFQFITCPDSRYGHFRRGVDFIQKHIFPGSLLLSLNRLNDLLARRGDFILHNLEDLGHDYARTLRSWRECFGTRFEDVRKLGFDDRFIRKWSYYLSYCEAAFAMRNISVVQAVYTRPNNLAL